MTRILLLALLLAFGGGCARYHLGSRLNENFRMVEIAPVENLTNEVRLEAMLRNSLAESVVTTPGVSLAAPGGAGVVLRTRIEGLEQQRGARARLRAHHDRDKSGKTYQTVVFRVTLKVAYELVRDDDVLCSGIVETTGDYPTMADQETGRVEALREALRSAARKVVAEVTEG